MKYITLALALSITASGFAQEAKPVTCYYAYTNPLSLGYPCHPVTEYVTEYSVPAAKWNDPAYIGVVHHSHKLRNGLLLGAGAAIGAVAIGFMATHGSNAPKGTSGQYSTGLNPVPQVFK